MSRRSDPKEPVARHVCPRALFSAVFFAALFFLNVGSSIAQNAGNVRESGSNADRSAGAPTSSAVVAGTVSMEVLDDRRSLGIGDRISYRVVEERRDPIPLQVLDSGEVEVPLIGRVMAQGRTCKQLAQAIKDPLEREYFFHATVIIGLDSAMPRGRGRVYMTGQVRSQGAVEIAPDETLTLSKAVLRAGGLAEFANARKVKIVRKKGGTTETFVVDLEEITKKGRLEKDPELQAEDVVIVPERLVNF